MKKIFVVALTVLIFGCSAYQPPKDYNIIKELIVEKSFDDTWAKVIEWFSSQGTPIKNMDKNSGFISTEYSLNAEQSNCLDCGKAGSAGLLGRQSITNPTGNFNVLIKKIDNNRTKVTVNCFFKAVSRIQVMRETSENVLDCKSTGILEKKILDFISQ